MKKALLSALLIAAFLTAALFSLSATWGAGGRAEAIEPEPTPSQSKEAFVRQQMASKLETGEENNYKADFLEVFEVYGELNQENDELVKTEANYHQMKESQPEVEVEVETEPEADEAQTATEEADAWEREMLAILIYQEAGSNACCDLCRHRVADVALNRVNDNRFPNTLEEVLTAPLQYGMLSYTGIKWSDRAAYESEQEAVARAYAVADDILSGNHSELYGEGYIWQSENPQGSEQIFCCGIIYGK